MAQRPRQPGQQAGRHRPASLTSRDQPSHATLPAKAARKSWASHYKTLGYDSAGAMYDAFTANAENQYTGFFDFPDQFGLIDKLSASDIEGFVTG